MPCDYCGEQFDPIATRWLCPHCHMKANCCNGAPLPPVVTDDTSATSYTMGRPPGS